MTAKISPGVVLVNKFTLPTDKAYKKYIEYIDRDEAVRNGSLKDMISFDLYRQLHAAQAPDEMSFDGFTDYMSNPLKTSELFTASSDKLSDEGKRVLKSAFETAQANASPMWQSVISFDNKFLEENDCYDSQTKELDEEKVKKATRKCIHTLLEKEGIKDTSVWSAAIHYNTDNLHVHVAAVEPVPTREKIVGGKYDGQYRGKFKQSSLDAGKRQVVSEIFGELPEQKAINAIIRESIIANKKNNPLIADPQIGADFLRLIEQLPADKRMWNYNQNAIANERALVDKISKAYIEKYHRADFNKLLELTESAHEKYTRAYGENSSADKFAEGKIDDLYCRLGNQILREAREYVKSTGNNQIVNKAARQLLEHRSGHLLMTDGVFRQTGAALTRAMNAMRRGAKSEFESIKAQREYERNIELGDR